MQIFRQQEIIGLQAFADKSGLLTQFALGYILYCKSLGHRKGIIHNMCCMYNHIHNINEGIEFPPYDAIQIARINAVIADIHYHNIKIIITLVNTGRRIDTGSYVINTIT